MKTSTLEYCEPKSDYHCPVLQITLKTQSICKTWDRWGSGFGSALYKPEGFSVFGRRIVSDCGQNSPKLEPVGISETLQI